MNSRFWTADYIGLGPYKLVNWEPGSFAQVEAFDGFFGTGPRIRTITVQFIPDTNAELAAILGGQTDVHLGGALGVEQAVVLKDFYQIDPGDNIAPTAPTEVFIGYDSKFLYLGFHCYDDPSKVRASVVKRDEAFG